MVTFLVRFGEIFGSFSHKFPCAVLLVLSLEEINGIIKIIYYLLQALINPGLTLALPVCVLPIIPLLHLYVTYSAFRLYILIQFHSFHRL